MSTLKTRIQEIKALSKKPAIFVKIMRDGGVATVPYIPEGNLHAEAHGIDERKVGTQLSKKGIPVVANACNQYFCMMVQTAEIEKDEIIFPVEIVQEFMPMIDEYNKTKDDSILIKLGEVIRKHLATTEDPSNKFKKEIDKIQT